MKKQTTSTFIFVVMLLSLFSLTSVVTSVSASSPQLISSQFYGKSLSAPGKGSGGGKTVTIEHELFIEIDYVAGHEPTPSVLTYIHNYYHARGINMTFYIDDLVTDPTPETGVTYEDFWSVESGYNDHDDGYYSKWKWVLFGTTVEGAPNVAGYAYVTYSIRYVPATGKILDVDGLAGNYIFMADETGDNYAASTPTVEANEVEAVVLMHEIGHSIGIINFGWSGNVYTEFTVWEIYDPDTTSVMSYLNPDNCNAVDKEGNANWHYSKEYWRLRNMEYYEI